MKLLWFYDGGEPMFGAWPGWWRTPRVVMATVLYRLAWFLLRVAYRLHGGRTFATPPVPFVLMSWTQDEQSGTHYFCQLDHDGEPLTIRDISHARAAMQPAAPPNAGTQP